MTVAFDNGKPQPPFRSGLTPALALDTPQREQQVDLLIWDRLPLDLREDGLEVRPDLLPCIRAKPRARLLLIQISLDTH
ncbi:hypothetical protein [Microvirga lotononidis]|uniref:hypothetical protein n=1 Tax=Microvirga lotononidis TaxID=864069 RepID=UPI0002F50E97|nr:hypothetical protein [Microvirga lotononidis]WQO27465.1 hypothetical protein U0023_22975 [Microvirga lotononidis]